MTNSENLRLTRNETNFRARIHEQIFKSHTWIKYFYFKQNTRQKWDIVEFRSVPAHIEN